MARAIGGSCHDPMMGSRGGGALKVWRRCGVRKAVCNAVTGVVIGGLLHEESGGLWTSYSGHDHAGGLARPSGRCVVVGGVQALGKRRLDSNTPDKRAKYRHVANYVPTDFIDAFVEFDYFLNEVFAYYCGVLICAPASFGRGY